MTEISPQLLKGPLDGALLLVISQSETYGYEITEKLEQLGFLSIAAGTIYPILQKLEREKMIQGEMRKSQEGPKRKYFTITTAGQNRLKTFLADWQALTQAMQNLIKEVSK
ncbi:PadR family transcriptional regulator [Lactococcus kimchii]|uniref:PadR family transcriptional regulator n=1 Tax=Lactococcus sp. S-13 TaxID=2507158 RepID=UPI001023801F|nr:PadR family transcriptional regulator [Lactococcus sp. S-13]RZI49381.1 PadR family transcriptional regulator [Lactococcus sp. S-13]